MLVKAANDVTYWRHRSAASSRPSLLYTSGTNSVTLRVGRIIPFWCDSLTELFFYTNKMSSCIDKCNTNECISPLIGIIIGPCYLGYVGFISYHIVISIFVRSNTIRTRQHLTNELKYIWLYCWLVCLTHKTMIFIHLLHIQSLSADHV